MNSGKSIALLKFIAISSLRNNLTCLQTTCQYKCCGWRVNVGSMLAWVMWVASQCVQCASVVSVLTLVACVACQRR